MLVRALSFVLFKLGVAWIVHYLTICLNCYQSPFLYRGVCLQTKIRNGGYPIYLSRM